MDTRLIDALRIAPGIDLYQLSLAVSQMPSDPQIPPRRPDVAAFKLGDAVSFTDKHLRERIGTITRMNTTTYSLLCDGEQWRVLPGLLREVVDVYNPGTVNARKHINASAKSRTALAPSSWHRAAARACKACSLAARPRRCWFIRQYRFLCFTRHIESARAPGSGWARAKGTFVSTGPSLTAM